MIYDEKEFEKQIIYLEKLNHHDLLNIAYSIMYNLTIGFSKNKNMKVDRDTYTDMIYQITAKYNNLKNKRGSN